MILNIKGFIKRRANLALYFWKCYSLLLMDKKKASVNTEAFKKMMLYNYLDNVQVSVYPFDVIDTHCACAVFLETPTIL